MKKTRTGRTRRAVCTGPAGSEHLFGQLHAAHTLVVAFHSGGFFALALGRGLFVELAGAQVGEQAQFFNGALEAAQGDVEGFVVFNSDRGHVWEMFP